MTHSNSVYRLISTKAVLIFTFLLIGIESIICSWVLMRIPGDPENEIFAGLSLPRILLALVLIGGGISSLLLVYRLVQNKIFSSFLVQFIQLNYKRLSIFFILSTICTWTAVFLPVYRIGISSAYSERLTPIFVWFLLVSLQILAILIVERIRSKGGLRLEKNEYKLAVLSGGVFLVFSVSLVLIAITRWGVSPIVEFWEKTGVPVLAGQIFLVWFVGVGLIFFCDWCKIKEINSKTLKIKVDVFVFLIIWVISAVLWVQEPMQFNHFNPGPFPPNNQYYPNSDAEVYDLAAQKAWIGKDPGYVDKPFYSALLLGFHLVAGQDVNYIIDIQTALLAIFPAIIYLLGSRLHSRQGGLLAALLANFKEINAFRAQSLIWKTSTPKLMMSEFPNAVLLVLISLFLWRWFSQKEKYSLGALSVGGVLGISVLTRHNNWLFFPLILLLAGLVLWKKKEILLINVVLFIAMFFATIGPWMGYSNQHYGQPLPFMTALNGAVLKNRIKPLIEQVTPTPEQGAYDPPGEVQTVYHDDVSNATQGVQQKSDEIEYSESKITNHAVIDVVIRHFFHNLVSTALTLPVTPVFDNIETTFRSSEASSIWNLEWNGKLKPYQILFLLINLMFVSLGVAQSWLRWRLAGLMPLAVLLGYLLATAVATTSGGRYIVPADWVIYLYYALGMAQLLEFLGTKVWGMTVPVFKSNFDCVAESASLNNIWLHGTIAGIFILLGFLPVLALSSYQPKYPEYTQKEIIENVLKPNANTDQKELTLLIKAAEDGTLAIIHGRMLNPVYLDYKDDSSYEVNVSDGVKGIPSLVFSVIGIQNEFLRGHLAMDETPSPLINGSDAVVFTCPDLKTAQALIMLEEDNTLRILFHAKWPKMDCSVPP